MSAATVPDRELVERIQSGDHGAFAELYVRYRLNVYRLLLGRVRNHETAEDLTQEVFTRAFRSASSLRWKEGAGPLAWLFTIARNIHIDTLKGKQGKLVALTSPTALDEAIGMPDPGPGGDTEAAALLRISVDEMLAALPRLSAVQRRCLALRFVKGLTVRETAAVTGVSETAVKSTTVRAVKALAQQMLPPPATRPAAFRPPADGEPVRSWARSQGFRCGNRGQLSTLVLTAYAEAGRR